MSDSFEINYDAIVLLEGIPLNDEDLKNIQKQIRMWRKLPPFVALAVLPVMAFICWLIRDNFIDFKWYDYLLLLMATLVGYAFVFLVCWLIGMYDIKNYKKDMLNGKARLTSILAGRDKTEYGEYFSFSGKEQQSKIRIRVKQEAYKLYAEGDWLTIEYLPYSKEALWVIRSESV